MPRTIEPAALCEYLGVNRQKLARMRKAGSIPAPIPGSRNYDFEAVKRRLDNVNEPGHSDQLSDEDELIARARKWRKSA